MGYPLQVNTTLLKLSYKSRLGSSPIDEVSSPLFSYQRFERSPATVQIADKFNICVDLKRLRFKSTQTSLVRACEFYTKRSIKLRAYSVEPRHQLRIQPHGLIL